MTEETTPASPKTKDSVCSECGRETRHHVHAKTTRGGGDDDFSWSQTSEFLECAGCGWTSIRKVYWDDSYTYPDPPEVRLYPSNLSRRKPDWLWQVDKRFSQLFEEVYAALGAGTVAVPVMGARAILDMVIQDKVGDRGGFGAGLDRLVDQGLLSPHDRGILEAAVEAGHAAAHRGFIPKAEEAVRVVDIAEHLVSSFYVLKPAAKVLKKSTPKRRGRKRRSAQARVK